MTDKPMTEEELAEIEQRRGNCTEDVPALIAEVRRLQKENVGLDAAVASLTETVYALMERPDADR